MTEENEDLGNIPGIGPSRRSVLAAAGITSRATLARMSIEQLISLTGMPRTQAERALASATSADGLSTSAPEVAPLTDDAFPPVAPGRAGNGTVPPEETLEAAEQAFPGEPVLADEDQKPAVAAQAELQRAAARVRTALSDVTRIWAVPKLERSLARLATVVDRLDSVVVESLSRKAARRTAARLDRLAAWLENAVAGAAKLTDRRRRRIRERLRADRQYIEQRVDRIARRARARKKRTRAKSGHPETA